MSAGAPEERCLAINDRPIREDGRFVLYWMIAARRTRASFALDRAIALARALGRPLLVLEPLRAGYRWASDRLHRFVLEGMAANARALARSPIVYRAYVEPAPGHGSGLLEALAAEACAVVTDDSPCFFIPRMVQAAAKRVPVRLEAVDGNGLLPIRRADRLHKTARSFRRFAQKELPDALADRPAMDPATGLELPSLAALPATVDARWPLLASAEAIEAVDLAALPIDHAVVPVATPGGAEAAARALDAFIATRLERYADGRNQPDDDASSGLSPYLHFGHLGAHEVFERVTDAEGWTLGSLHPGATGSRTGYWGASEAAEAFLDQLVTWREVGCNFCVQRPDTYDRFSSLPGWARETLLEHADDPRPAVYGLEAFESAGTHDPIWNAAQVQLVREGRIHNYLRMVWGKKILHWSRSPEEALDIMIELNNRYALDGRDPSSYSGIFWVLGRYDRAWGPERDVFGKVRYMSTESTRRKLRLKRYLETYAGAARANERVAR